MSKNILFVSPNPIWGGAATANLAIAKMLQDDGYRVIYNDEYADVDIYNGIYIDHTPIHQKKFSERSLLSQLIKRHGIGFIIWSPLAAIYFYREIKKLKKQGVRQIAIVHSLSLMNNLKGRLMDFLVSMTLSQMTTIVYVSQYTKDSWDKFRVIRKSNVNKVVIHNVVDIHPDKHIPNLSKPRIGFVGRLSEEKQPHIFCELSNKSTYNFYAFGDGPLMPSLKYRYGNVEFMGQCNDLYEIYANIDVLVMTSKFENCPMVILEAQSFGIPCVAPNVGGIPEIVESGVNGILFEEYDIDGITCDLNKILSSYSEFSENCRNSSKVHNVQNTIKQWERILK